jgi:hypothetical protein
VDGIVNGLCLNISASTSVEYQWPNVYFFIESPSCEGTHDTDNVDEFICLTHNTFEDDDYITYETYLSFSNIVSSSSNALSAGAVAGIVIGSLVAISIAGAAGYYLGNGGRGQPMASADQANNRL